MKQTTTILVILALLVVSAVFIVVWQNGGLQQVEAQTTLPPALFFSDLTDGPATGWEGSVTKVKEQPKM